MVVRDEYLNIEEGLGVVSDSNNRRKRERHLTRDRVTRSASGHRRQLEALAYALLIVDLHYLIASDLCLRFGTSFGLFLLADRKFLQRSP